ncbi:MAG: class I SAM-dependent methyltransferase, partial [Methylacidiphilaceae bacterium]|nr:class I SAM-dependent methyltransferase [Candidatus Methylacidiphilaceae bacterium]
MRQDVDGLGQAEAEAEAGAARIGSPLSPKGGSFAPAATNSLNPRGQTLILTSVTQVAPPSGFDSLPADSTAFAPSHPARLAALGRLFALHPSHPAQARVLEIGCGAGGNLLPMAALYPRASFVGIDSSAVRIEEGLARIFALGLHNVELRCLALNPVGENWDAVDYLIAHGACPWV